MSSKEQIIGIDWQRYCSKKPLVSQCKEGVFGHTPLPEFRDLPPINKD